MGSAPLRRRGGRPWTPSAPAADSALADPATFVGGMNVPSRLGGRLNATIPLARLTISADSLRMHQRFFISAMFSDFHVRLRDVAAAFRLRGTLMTSGVGFELSNGQLAYFWTLWGMGRILSALQQRGVPIEGEPHRARGVVAGQFGILWNWGRFNSPSSVANVPAYSKSMSRFLPLLLALDVAAVVIFASTGTPFGWLAAAIGIVWAVRSVLGWWRRRDR